MKEERTGVSTAAATPLARESYRAKPCHTLNCDCNNKESFNGCVYNAEDVERERAESLKAIKQLLNDCDYYVERRDEEIAENLVLRKRAEALKQTIEELKADRDDATAEWYKLRKENKRLQAKRGEWARKISGIKLECQRQAKGAFYTCRQEFEDELDWCSACSANKRLEALAGEIRGDK